MRQIEQENTQVMCNCCERIVSGSEITGACSNCSSVYCNDCVGDNLDFPDVYNRCDCFEFESIGRDEATYICKECKRGIFPLYGLAPHIHTKHKKGEIETKLKNKSNWPSNFREDPQAPGLGVYLCNDKACAYYGGN